MILTGSFTRSLDEKLRLALPKTWREVLASESQLVLTPGTDGSLALFPAAAFADLAKKLADRSPNGQEVRAFSRLLYAQSQNAEIDPQGRIRLAPESARLAQLDDEVALIGVGDHIELWNKSRWDAYFSQLQPQYDRLAEDAFCDRPSESRSAKTDVAKRRTKTPK